MRNKRRIWSLVFGLAGLFLISISSAQTRPTTATATTVIDPATAQRLEALGKRPHRIHDPSTIVKCKDEYWIFYTGRGTPTYRSKDLITWTRGPVTFRVSPPWVAKNVPANRGGLDFWAPEVKHVGNQYLLYYSVSSFGKNTSAIGLATNPTLDPDDPNYKWTDRGMVIGSTIKDDFNAIDPAVTEDANGGLWLSLGSFWSGIRLTQLDPATGLRIAPDSPIYTLAYNGSIEASYLYRHGDYVYLFVNWGMCCRGINSTYNTRIGRSIKVTGPYLDKEGKDMLDGGGSPFLVTDGPVVGPGQVGILYDGDSYWMTLHYYDGSQRGASMLAIRPLTWGADGWPIVGEVKVKP
jgi:arabinan endo-1,5-alpha-L-arabinosidase